ncbi:hypothetical protein MMC07_005810 [Pseudocyphellaria aurata]|nr:hypothetical protein [Pseudocyphellaria aurata]
MSEFLIPLFCVAEISAEVSLPSPPPDDAASPIATGLLTTTAPDHLKPPRRSVRRQSGHAAESGGVSRTGSAHRHGGCPTITSPPHRVLHLPLSRSLGPRPRRLASNRDDSGISSHQFLIADEQTNEDRTVLFVDRGYEPGEPPETVRLDAAYANGVPVAVQVATMDVNGVRALVDDDGVYRGGPSRPEPRKGGRAPRKRLGG